MIVHIFEKNGFSSIYIYDCDLSFKTYFWGQRTHLVENIKFANDFDVSKHEPQKISIEHQISKIVFNEILSIVFKHFDSERVLFTHFSVLLRQTSNQL